MKTFKEQNQELEEKQTSYIGWAGITDVGMAREIYRDIEPFLEEDERNEEYMVNRISKVISKIRSY